MSDTDPMFRQDRLEFNDIFLVVLSAGTWIWTCLTSPFATESSGTISHRQ